MSCNTLAGNASPTALAALIRDYSVDVVALQELSRDFKFPVPRDWHCHEEGNLAVCSRFSLEPGQSVATFHPPHKWKRYSGVGAVLDTDQGKVAFFAVHLPSARYGLQNVVSRSVGIAPAKAGLLEKETSGREEASELVRSLADQTQLPTIVAGDFNMARQSLIFRHVWGSFQDAFEETANGYGWTFFDEYLGIPVPRLSTTS